MTFTESVKSVFSKYAKFEGRASRSEYWYFVLFNLVVSIALALLDVAIFGVDKDVFSSIYSIAILLPSLAVAVRRMHDSGKSGKNYLWVFTIIGIFYVLYLMLVKSDPLPNKYGNPEGYDENNNSFLENRKDIENMGGDLVI